MKKFFLITILATLLLSCSEDSITGTWSLTGVSVEGEEMFLNEYNIGEYLCFKSDGTFIDVKYEDDDFTALYGKWKHSDDEIRVEITEGLHAGTAFTYTILYQSSREITITFWGLNATLTKVPDSVIKHYLE